MQLAPSWYNPWMHLLGPSLVGLGIVVTALSLMKSPTAWDLLTVPVALVFLNLLEWTIHRDFLHTHRSPLGFLYYRHIEHHFSFHEDDMAIREPRELYLVLMPAPAIIAAFVTSLPIPLVLTLLGLGNAACVFAAVTMSYLMAYEMLHASYHAPATSRIGRSRAVALLRRHHARHHSPALMQSNNFNVTVPLGDSVFGTTSRSISSDK